MKILVIGGGGREHALVWKISQSKKVEKIYCAPGNVGIAKIAECIQISVSDIKGLVKFAKNEKINLTIVGPEAPLINGIVDEFKSAGLCIFGPSKNAAQLEGNKALAKHFMAKYNIPTAKYAAFSDFNEAAEYIRGKGSPLVVKVSGLAAGKGVMVCKHTADALEALNRIFIDKEFGDAGNQVVIEEFLEGEEVSVLAFTDGKTILPMIASQDHKRAFDGDKGPNTGGMGAYAPAPLYTDEIAQKVLNEILKPTVEGLNIHGWEYKGVIYVGLMLAPNGPKVLEYNVRFGDPETQPLMMLLNSDVVEIMEAVIDERLNQTNILWKQGASVCVVMASKGYPGKYEKGYAITGIDGAEGEDIAVFHAGTKLYNGQIVTNGGRVLGITALGDNLKNAVNRAYDAVNKIHFENAFFRKDIAHKVLK